MAEHHTDLILLDASLKVMADVLDLESLESFGRALKDEQLTSHDRMILRAVYTAKKQWLEENDWGVVE